MSMQQLAWLKEFFVDIDKAIENGSVSDVHHIGGDLFAEVHSSIEGAIISMNMKLRTGNRPKPAATGVTITSNEWTEFRNVITAM